MQSFNSEEKAAGDRVEWIKEQFAEYQFVADFAQALKKPYVEGLENLPEDGRFLLVANHVISGSDVPLIQYEVSRRIGKQVRGLAHRFFGQMPGFFGDLFQAMGGVVGSPENAAALMAANEPILVFPGGAPEVGRGKDELHQLRWGDRKGFARIAVQHNYPIIPTTLVGADFEYQVLDRADGVLGKAVKAAIKSFSGEEPELPPVKRGVAGTSFRYPQRMYLRFSPPIETAKPAKVSVEKWVDSVRDATRAAIESSFEDLLAVRRRDPFRHLAPWARSRAIVAA
ncbi:MAG: lysophospholipid acyltransferase family protein [Segniliparus sp.]|uniref:lysophospholipid acyltransferase family protein n=1 Tax=Segniliparus sp. TaxID=2804064 RepID=UPI003F3B4FBA